LAAFFRLVLRRQVARGASEPFLDGFRRRTTSGFALYIEPIARVSVVVGDVVQALLGVRAKLMIATAMFFFFIIERSNRSNGGDQR
jgi:hypothetical protein